RKEGMANQYGNLGNVSQTRGDLEQAEAMYRKSLSLFESLGAKPMVEKVKGLLLELKNKK
ncbi:MAG: tetratricopeptide repeat protein, partial [Proteobacteria bacterium]|nr:tetratricopeptide repeat protein [Pseudomonadota bacterium]